MYLTIIYEATTKNKKPRVKKKKTEVNYSTSASRWYKCIYL